MVVHFDIELLRIIQVDEKHQVITTNILRYLHWKDEFLQWKPEIYGNITEYNQSGPGVKKLQHRTVPKYEISSDYFQEDNGEWNLLGITSNSSSTMYSCCPDDGYIRINYTIHLKRRAFYYFFNLLVPCGLIGFLAILGFTLPPESGEKLPLGATILFSLIVFLNMISESMPANSDTVPLLGTYFNCVMFTIALSVVSTIVINVNLKAANPKRVDGLTKKIFLRWLPRMLRMNISSNIVTEQDPVLWNKKMVEDTITIQIKRSGGVETVVTYSLHADKIVAQQWSCVAAVVDRMCLVFSLIVTFLSVTIFLVYAY
ncbi:neuronal acetylcholine receptor subunit beta-3-like [Bradysia coprophila]|uniref:neuronal acetylcholine receptor subunit beta-3-like n=1 Tax=Bradysia coprophila TaxID=38358 RepID=UPI00187D8AD4|nr:neuronal acetylcholine receptor subunit beta-3-like [Bradysia coprophila]